MEIVQHIVDISGGSRISQTGGANPLNLGQKPIMWQDIYRKLHENERIWTGDASLAPPGIRQNT